MNARTKALEALMGKREKRKYPLTASPAFDTKRQALEHFMALKNKKKLPVFERREKKVNPEYKKMSIAEWEKKYLT